MKQMINQWQNLSSNNTFSSWKQNRTDGQIEKKEDKLLPVNKKK